MEKKHGKIPVNARVDIDYSKGKPKIQFGYTTKKGLKKSAIKQNIFGFHTVIIALLMYGIVYLIVGHTALTPTPTNCTAGSYNSTFGAINLTCHENGNIINHTIIFNNQHLTWFNEPSAFQDLVYKNSFGTFTLIKSICLFFTLFVVFLVIDICVTKILVKQKWYQEWLPKHNAQSGPRYYYKYKPKDVLGNCIVIPSFHNIELTYKTNKDFSTQLNHIYIRERRYHRIRKMKIDKKVDIDNYKWYAIFEFKDIPKDGWLEVWYR